MKLSELVERVRALNDLVGDPEAAHGVEDGIKNDVLRWIAYHPEDPNVANLALVALSTDNIDFPRWCA